MEMRHLQTFMTIVELYGFTKAAEYLGYAQSTITSHIQLLEEEIGSPLFDRLGKKIVLTSIGRELLPYAVEMLKIYKSVKNICINQNSIAGDLVIGAPESLTVYRMKQILSEYRKSFPQVNILLKKAVVIEYFLKAI